MRQELKPLHSRRKRCPCCKGLFEPDRRTKGSQRYCSKPECQTMRQRQNEQAWRQRNPDCLAYQQEQSRQWYKDHPDYGRQRRRDYPDLVVENRDDTRVRMQKKRGKEMFDKSKSIVMQLIGNSKDKCYLVHGGRGIYLSLTKASPLSKTGSVVDNRKDCKRVANCLPCGRLYDLSRLL